MVRNKETVSWTIDKDIVEFIDKEADEESRSKSHIANKYLRSGTK